MMKERTRIFRFVVIGTLNAIITAGVILIMMELFHFDYMIANVAGYIAALINNFFWSKYWIFSSGQGQYKNEIPLFLLAFALAYSAQFISLLITIEWLDMHEYVGQFLGLFVYGAVNFIMNRRVTFKMQ